MKTKRITNTLIVISCTIMLLVNICILFSIHIFKVQIKGGNISTSNNIESVNQIENANKTKGRIYTVKSSVWLDSVDESQIYNTFELIERIYRDKYLDEPYKIKRIHL